jgi:serine/threonine protein kinase
VKEANEVARSPHESSAELSSEDPTPDAAGDETELAQLQEGEVLAGRFVVVRLLARGGMGAVYEAHDAILRTRVAVKLIRSDLSNDATALDRFRREVLLGRQVSHPNVCRVYELYETNTAAGHHVRFLTMEFISGETLSKRLARGGRLSTQEALPLVEQMCAGLDAAHSAGVIHRDFKSSNVMLAAPSGDEDAQSTRVVLTDFGVARARETSQGSEQRRLTGEAGVLGTPDYMAPEQVTGADVTQAADIYALGVVLYELVTGRLPFSGSSPLASAARRLDEAPPSPELLAPGLDRQWSKVILRCLAREPRHRFHSAPDVAKALEKKPTSRTLLASSGIALLTLAVVVAARLLPHSAGMGSKKNQSTPTSPAPNPRHEAPALAPSAPATTSSKEGPVPKPLSDPKAESKRAAPVGLAKAKSKHPLTAHATTLSDEERFSKLAFTQREQSKPVAAVAPSGGRAPSTAPAANARDEGLEPTPPGLAAPSRDESLDSEPLPEPLARLKIVVENFPDFGFQSHCQDIDDQHEWTNTVQFKHQNFGLGRCQIAGRSARLDNGKARDPANIDIKLSKIIGLRLLSAEDFMRTSTYDMGHRWNCYLTPLTPQTPVPSWLVVEMTSGKASLAFRSSPEAESFLSLLEAASMSCGGLGGRTSELDSKAREQLRNALTSFYTFSFEADCAHLDNTDKWTDLEIVLQENARLDGCLLKWHFARIENKDIRKDHRQKELNLAKVTRVDRMPLEDVFRSEDVAARHRWRCSVAPAYSLVLVRAESFATDWMGFRSASEAETFASALEGVAKECGGLRGR